MKRMFIAVASIVSLITLSGCASSLMQETPTQEIAAPSQGKAKIVFMRTSFIASGIQCEVFDATDGKLQFIGQLPMGNKIVYETTPGKKTFMAYGAAADFMPAQIAAGKTYYAVVRPNWGTGGFAPTPIRSNGKSDPDLESEQFKKWVSDTKLLVQNESAHEWFKQNKARYEDIYTKYWERFTQKSGQEIAERTMMPGDGR
jgi:hypothetical protein